MTKNERILVATIRAMISEMEHIKYNVDDSGFQLMQHIEDAWDRAKRIGEKSLADLPDSTAVEAN